MIKKKQNILLYIVFLLQIILWWLAHEIKPTFIITPYPPTQIEINAFSFGDKQFLYRKLAFSLQNAGDKLGHYTNINNLDYTRIERWLKALDKMDTKSHYIPFMAAYYYAITNNPMNSKIIADYITDYASKDPTKHWRLLTTSAYIYYKNPAIAGNKLHNIGKILIKEHDIPMWAKSLAGFYLKDNGDICNAYKLISQISQDDFLISRGNAEDEFLLTLLEENIQRLKHTHQQDLAKCRFI
ncbi:MAG: hypothetical protein ACI9CD_000327 [Candidatus Deianiraeaceae bacterium]|jgi:hypothetical protein